MANAITQWINSKSDQSNVATNSEILKNSKMIEQDLTQILYAIVPMVDAINETEYETSGKINETLNKIGYLVEFVAATTANSLDELKQEEQEQNEKIVSLLSYEDQRAGALISAEPTTETKPLMISNESINALAEVISPAQDKMTEAITNMGNNVQQITNQTTEIIKNEREAKIDSLVKATEKPKEIVKPEKEKKDGPDFSGFFNGIKGMLKKFLSPVAWITAFIAEILPWVLIFGALFIGFWETASAKVKAYAIGIFAAILLSWRVLTGKIFNDIKLLLTFGKKLWTGVVWLVNSLHLKEHALKLGNIAKDFAMAVIRHTADMARIAYALACEHAKFIKDMFVTGFKFVKAIALFIADMARIVFQIAMAAAQYLLIAAAVIAIVALVGLIIFGLIKVIGLIAPMIANVITSFLSAAWEIIKNIAGTLVEFLAPVGKAVIDFLLALNPVYLIVKLITGIAGAIKDFFKSDKKEVEAEEPVSEEAASALGVTADAYNNMEQQKMNLFDSKMNAVLKQIKDLGKVIMLSAAATMVTAKFFGVNPQNGQAAPQGTSMFAQTVATDGSTASESVEKENTSNDYNNVLEQMVKILGEIRDKKIEVVSEKKGGLFNIF